ncbi:MAG: hypothetical protein LBG22_01730 [Treponema sp.]|jgi:hypothetical protein|nr:hypothetical protein [Treponema sp.]
MRKTVFLIITVLCVFSACLSTGDANRQPGPNETVVIVQRNKMSVYSGFKERIYIDGKQRLVLRNGDQGRIIVPNGTHTVHADLYTLTSQKVTFSAASGTMGLMITPYSIYDFAIEDLDEDVLLAAIQNTPATPVAQAVSSQPAAQETSPEPAAEPSQEATPAPSQPAAQETPAKPAVSQPAVQETPPKPAAAAPSQPPAQAPPAKQGFFARLFGTGSKSASTAAATPALAADITIETSLSRAAEKIIVKIPEGTRMAIVYVTAKDAEIAEFIANELEYIMLERDLTLIDRSNLDSIRKEQNFQLSGEVDDNQAVSVGKMAGAEVIIIGAITGSGDIRRLRLRALDTQTAQVVVAASERY